MSSRLGAAARTLALALAATVGLAVGVPGLLSLAESSVEATPPAIPEPRLAFFDGLRDARPVPLNVTEDWEKVGLVVEADDLLRDPTLWNRMNFDDWDRVPESLRTVGLDRMIARFRAAPSGPEVWEAMTPSDWDRVPQPIRAMAFIRIAEYWAEYYGVGVGVGVPWRDAGDTLAAILMVESWFEHRAVHVGPRGNRDLGLVQASDYFRARLERLHREKWLDFRLEEDDYFNPWLAILAGATWLDLMLHETRGDLDLAVRAYNRGIEAARAGAAEEYLENVKHKRDRFIRNRGAPPTWDLLSRRLRGLGSGVGRGRPAFSATRPGEERADP
jgi:hypothetical protein